MKKMLFLFVSVFLFGALCPVASAADTSQIVEYLPDGSYYITVVEDESSGIALLSTSATKSKTRTYYSSSGSARWYVKVTGTFTYGDGTSKCTSASVTAESYVSNWRISSKSISKNGNTATATATAEQLLLGQVVNTITQSVTLTCSSTGEFS